jgi:hypothetical protein
MAEYIKKGMPNGNVIITNSEKSLYPIYVYYNLHIPFLDKWGFLEKIDPSFYIEYFTDGEFKIDTDDKELLSVSDIDNGIAIHFDNIWSEIIYKDDNKYKYNNNFDVM